MSWHASLHVYSCLTLLVSHTLQAAERGSASPERASLVHVSARLLHSLAALIPLLSHTSARSK